MDKRGFPSGLLIFLAVNSAHGQHVLQPTEVSGQQITDIGTRQSTRPTQIFDNDQLHLDERPQLDQALDTLPGVQARIEGGASLNIRGSQSSARALVLEDGVPLNFSDGVGFNPLFVASENIKSVTLLKGPASSLFGHDALAGVLEFNSEILNSPKFFASEGSFNTQQAFAGAPFHLGQSHFQVTAFDTHADNNFSFRMPRTGVSGTRSSDDSETTRMTFEGSSGGNGSFQWKTFNLVARQIGSTPGAVGSNFPLAFNTWGDIVSVEVKETWTEKYSVGSKTSYKYLWQAYGTFAPGATSAVREGLSLVDKFGGGNVELFDDFTYENFQASYLPAGQVYYPLNEIGAGSFVEINDNLSGQAAIRFSSENGGFVPSIGFVGTKEDWRYFLNYSEGYRPASITQKYSQSPDFVGNLGLFPEHSYEVDLGFDKPYGNINTHMEVFSRDIYNLIQSQVLSPNVLTPRNAGHVHAYGFELSAETKIPVRAGVSLSYLNNQFVDTQTPVPLSPQYQVSAFAAQTWNKWNLAAQGTYWTSVYDTNSSVVNGPLTSLNDWLTIDLFATYTLTKEISARLAAINIFDQPKELAIGYPEPQRSFTLSILGYL